MLSTPNDEGGLVRGVLWVSVGIVGKPIPI